MVVWGVGKADRDSDEDLSDMVRVAKLLGGDVLKLGAAIFLGRGWLSCASSLGRIE